MLFFANIFQPLIDVFEAVLKFFHNSGGIPWGWSIVLLTICVRAVLVPLTIKQMGSMARLQQLQPELKAIQTKYKEDKERQQQEMMKFYKENNVNPLGSCLPMVAQLPVFISLYYMLRQSLRSDICPAVQKKFQAAYALKHHVSLASAAGQTTACGPGHHASFLFIADLTSVPTGLTLVVLIILYVGSQLASSLLMSSATMDPTQRKIMLFMPLIFVLFVIRFPAGVLVYWITTNIWTIGQQYLIKRRIGPTRPAAIVADAGPDSGSMVGITTSPRPRPGRSNGDAAPTTGGGLASIIRKASRPPEDKQPEKGSGKQPVATATRGGPPPKPPRKKKKRSGRRR